jgi:hypothetical protein
MDLKPIEQKVLAAVGAFSERLPEEQLQDMRELVQAGEPGIALENLCSQLYEYDIPVPVEVQATIVDAGRTMGIKPSYWERLSIT